MSKVVAVFHASGQLGRTVCKSLSRDFHVRAVVCDQNEENIAALKSCAPSASIVNVDPSLLKKDDLDNALDGAYGAVVITCTDFTRPDCQEIEIEQGKLIADACQRACIGHVVYNVQLTVLKVLGMRARHMDAKSSVEAYMKELGLPLSGLNLPLLYEALLVAPLRPTRLTEHNYELGE